MSNGEFRGLGSHPHDGGTWFGVWAPHADAVSVVGDFNGWDAGAHPMTRDGDTWSTDVSGASPGQEYKFAITNGDNVTQRIDPYARLCTSSVGNAVIYDDSAFDWGDDESFQAPPMNELVIYETHVGSFVTDGNGVGRLDLVASKLDYLGQLGINAIQLMPLMEFAGDYSWGYNPAHVFAVESSYGGPDALKHLVRSAHEHGIAVIVDVVYNHFGPSDLDMWQFDGWSEDGKGGIYFYQDWRSKTPWGDTRPDYGRQEVRQFIADNARMWLANYHADGLRWDMTPYIRSVDATVENIPEGRMMCREVNNEIRRDFPAAVSIAEDLHGDPTVTSTDDGGAGFHSQWDNHFVHPIRDAIIPRDDNARSIASIGEALTTSYGDPFARVIYTESHDEVANGQARVPQEADPQDPSSVWAQKAATLGAALTLTTPGIPMLFMGQEFLQDEWFRDNVPLDWSSLGEHQGIAVLHRDLIRVRRNWQDTTRGLTGGNIDLLVAEDDTKVIAYHRWMDGGPGDDVVVVVNLSGSTHQEHPIPFPASGHWPLVLNSDAKDYSEAFTGAFIGDADAQDENGMAVAHVTLPPYTTLIFSRAQS